jgi:hypothetical protein
MSKGKARCKKGHLYRVWSFESDEGGGDRGEVMRMKACNIDDAITYVKKQMFKPEFQKDVIVDGDDKFAIVDVYEPAEDQTEDDFIDRGRTVGFQIEECDEIGPEFKTIFGSNDFVDLTGKKPRKAKDWNETLALISRSGDNEALGRELTRRAQEEQKKEQEVDE